MIKRRHLVIPDCQVKPGVNTDHLEWLGCYIVKMKPDNIICIGDFADMPSLSSYEAKGSKEYEGKRYKEDIRAAKAGMKRLLDPLHKYQKWTVESHKPRYDPQMDLLLGNHEDRITRAINADPQHLEGLISLEDLAYESFGWTVHPFLQPAVIDGIAYCHFFPTGKKGLPASSARVILQQHHMSAFAGHTQGRDIAYGKRIDGKKLTTIICGSFYLHDEDYMPPPSNQHWRGVWVLHEVDDGQYDEMPVSIDYLKRKYGGSK